MAQPVALVIGASRGIGRQTALRLAASGYAVVVAAKSISPQPPSSAPDPNSSASTITTVAWEIAQAGGTATPLQVDVRSAESIESLLAKTISIYARLDVLIYNAGAIFWAPVSSTPLSRFQLMQRVNPEGLYAAVSASLPHLHRSGGRIVVVCPPIYSRFFRGKTAYAMGKVGMSVLVKGLAMDFEREGRGMAVTGVWPAVAIQSAATEQFTRDNPGELRDLRHPGIFADAILAILESAPDKVNGELVLDEDFLREHAGVSDFDKYSLVPGSSPRRIMPVKLPDLTVAEQDDEGKRHDSSKKAKL